MSLAAIRGSDWKSPFELGYLPFDRGGAPKLQVINADNEGLAQHHGVPTFLLDWTYNPIYACVFASEGNEPENDIAVWALDASSAELLSLNAHVLENHIARLLVHRPAPISNRFLGAQRGLFTSLQSADKFFDCEKRFPGVEEVIAPLTPQAILDRFGPERRIKGKHAYLGLHPEVAEKLEELQSRGPCLRKIVLRATEVREFRLLLGRERVTKAHLMPTLDNVRETSMLMAADEASSRLEQTSDKPN